jgi:hypothetical protein
MNSPIRFRIVLDRLSVLLSPGTLGRIEDVSLQSSCVDLTNSSNIHRIVLSAVRWWDSLGGNAAVVDFMKKSIDWVPITNIQYKSRGICRITLIQRTLT